MSFHSIASGPRCLTEETLRLQAKSDIAISEMIGTLQYGQLEPFTDLDPMGSTVSGVEIVKLGARLKVNEIEVTATGGQQTVLTNEFELTNAKAARLNDFFLMTSTERGLSKSRMISKVCFVLRVLNIIPQTSAPSDSVPSNSSSSSARVKLKRALNSSRRSYIDVPVVSTNQKCHPDVE